MKKSDTGIEIIAVVNGFSVKESDGTITVIQEDLNDEHSAAEALLYKVIEYFNFNKSRYDREQIAIIRKMGDKYEPHHDEKAVTKFYKQIKK